MNSELDKVVWDKKLNGESQQQSLVIAKGKRWNDVTLPHCIDQSVRQ